MAQAVILFLAASAVIVFLAALRQRKQTREEEQMVLRLRGTELYSHIYPFFERHDDLWLENLILREEGLSIRVIYPFGQMDHYTFAAHGRDNLTQDTLYALAMAALVDIHILQNRSHYAFRTYHDTLGSGQRVYWYEYAMRPHWRKKVLKMAAEDSANESPDA